jgi:hypothetical protein
MRKQEADMKRMWIGVVGLVLWAASNAPAANLAETQKENLSAQSRVVAIATANLENAVRGRALTDADTEAATAVAKFHSAAESFARASERWLDTANVNWSYQALIEAWFKVKQTFPALKADALTTKTYDRAMREFDKLDRYAGYGGKTYEKKQKAKK